MSVTRSLSLIRNELKLFVAQSSERFSDLETRLSALEEQVDKLLTPADTHRADDKTLRKRRRETPVPDRPAVMVAAGVGEDPR